MTAADRSAASSNGRAASASRYPLSPQQRRMIDLGQGGRGLVSQAAVAISGPLDAVRLEQAANRLVDRYEILRTTYSDVSTEQVAASHGAPSWRTMESSGQSLARLLADERQAPFDLRAEPVLRLALARLGPGEHALLVTLPAFCADPPSAALLIEQLAAEYGGRPPAVDLLQYGDLAQWLNELPGEDADGVGRELWRSHAAADSLDVGSAFGEPSPSAAFTTACISTAFDATTAGAIEAAAVGLGSSAESVIAVCWHVILAQLAGGKPVAVGTFFDGRPYPELVDAIGPLARYLPLRLALDPREPFAAAVSRYDAALADAGDWQECFSWRLFPAGAPAAIPACFEIGCNPPPVTAGGCTFTVAARHGSVDRFRVRLGCWRRDGELVLELHHDTAALDAAAARQLLLRTAWLAGQAAAAPGAWLGSLGGLDPAEERRLIDEFNAAATAMPAVERYVHERIADHARRGPSDIALAFRGEHISYAELDARANQLARTLARTGRGPEDCVGVCLERSIDLVVTLLGVLKAGAAYIALDPAYPAERISYMLTDANVSTVVTREALAGRLACYDRQVVLIDSDRATIEAEPIDSPEIAISPMNLAYVIYTSGSTGTPKGAMVTHGALANYTSWCAQAYSIALGTGAPVHTPIGFDLTVTALYGPLSAGRTAVLVPENEGLDGLAMLLRARHDFSLVKLTPSQLDALSQLIPAAEAAGCTRAFVLGGEPLAEVSLKFWREHAPETRIINEYGPTEATVGCIVHEAERATTHGWRVPIGRPIPGMSAYVLDSQLNPVPVGIPGELYLGGVGVARGYLGRPGLTAERFAPDPFASVPGSRLYRTGDRARHLPEGGLEFLDRIDRQVKIRGFRVEPEEIEHVLVAHDSVERAVVVVRSGPGGPRLVAYCTRRRGAMLAPEELDAFLAARLPAYLLPAEQIVLDFLPLTANGKVDVAALPASAPARQPYVAPATSVEQVLAAIWADVLGVDRIGIHDNFFELGGQSMLAARLIFLIRDALQIDLPLRTVFEAPTVAAMAQELELAGADHARTEATARIAIEVAELSEDEVSAALAARRGSGSA